MKSKESVEAEIEALKVKDDWGTRREIKKLPSILDEEEHILALSSGQKLKLMSINGYTNILLVCTNLRVIMMDRGLIQTKLDEVSLKDITSIEKNDGILFSKLKITKVSGKPLKLKKINKDAAQAFCNEVQKGRMGNIVINEFVSNTKENLKEELSDLKEMFDEGLLTQEEYDSKRKQILNI